MKAKKWELIAKAHQEYPKGTKIRFGVYVSTVDGNYKFFDSATIVDSQGNWVYNADVKPYWAEIITDKPKSILDGKIAIQVNNDREMYEVNKYLKTNWNARNHNYPVFVFTGKKEGFTSSSDVGYGYNSILFEDFAKETNITAPEFILTSEDGVPLYQGDKGWVAYKLEGGKYFYLGAQIDIVSKSWDYSFISSLDMSKLFSTKEAAIAWIELNNKPKELKLKSILGYVSAITKNYIDQYGKVITTEQIEEIYLAQKSL